LWNNFNRPTGKVITIVEVRNAQRPKGKNWIGTAIDDKKTSVPLSTIANAIHDGVLRRL
jgi:hypothetical protein